MYEISEMREIIRERLGKKRYLHSLNVAAEAVKFAKRWGFDEDKAYIAGLLHDCCKDAPQAEQREMAEKSRFTISDTESVSPPLWHAIAGAWYAENMLHIEDDDILSAMRYHTVAKADMTDLEVTIYLADLISADRSYKDVQRMRKLSYIDINKAMLEALEFYISDVSSKGARLPITAVEAYNQYVARCTNTNNKQ